MLCVLSLAIASVLHVVGDVQLGNAEAGQAVVSGAVDEPGTQSASTAESCHSCSVASYFNAVAAADVAAASPDIPDGRLVRMSAVSLRAAGPPPKN